MMKTTLGKGIVMAALGLTLHLPLHAAPETHEIDPAHSTIGFKIKHLFTDLGGRFNDVKGTLVIDPDKPEEAKVEATIATTSIDTANAKRDEHLRNADFFDTEKNKAITFKSKSVKKTGDKTADVTGDFTLNGVTKEVILNVEFLGKGPGMQGETRSGWRGKTSIKRSDYGMTYGSKPIEGTPLIGDEVEITLDIEALVKP